MSRVKRGYKGTRRRKKLLNLASGYRGTRSKLYKVAVNVVKKALSYAYRDRKVKKREFRKLWITRINAAVRSHGVSYSRFINGLKKVNVDIDRKTLSNIAVTDPKGFKEIVDIAVK